MTYRTSATWWREAKQASVYPSKVHISDLHLGDVVAMINSKGEVFTEAYYHMTVVCVNHDWVTFWRPTVLASSKLPFEVHVEKFSANRFHTGLFYRVISRTEYPVQATCDGVQTQ